MSSAALCPTAPLGSDSALQLPASPHYPSCSLAGGKHWLPPRRSASLSRGSSQSGEIWKERCAESSPAALPGPRAAQSRRGPPHQPHPRPQHRAGSRARLWLHSSAPRSRHGKLRSPRRRSGFGCALSLHRRSGSPRGARAPGTAQGAAANATAHEAPSKGRRVRSNRREPRCQPCSAAWPEAARALGAPAARTNGSVAPGPANCEKRGQAASPREGGRDSAPGTPTASGPRRRGPRTPGRPGPRPLHSGRVTSPPAPAPPLSRWRRTEFSTSPATAQPPAARSRPPAPAAPIPAPRRRDAPRAARPAGPGAPRARGGRARASGGKERGRAAAAGNRRMRSRRPRHGARLRTPSARVARAAGRAPGPAEPRAGAAHRERGGAASGRSEPNRAPRPLASGAARTHPVSLGAELEGRLLLGLAVRLPLRLAVVPPQQREALPAAQQPPEPAGERHRPAGPGSLPASRSGRRRRRPGRAGPAASPTSANRRARPGAERGSRYNGPPFASSAGRGRAAERGGGRRRDRAVGESGRGCRFAPGLRRGPALAKQRFAPGGEPRARGVTQRSWQRPVPSTRRSPGPGGPGMPVPRAGRSSHVARNDATPLPPARPFHPSVRRARLVLSQPRLHRAHDAGAGSRPVLPAPSPRLLQHRKG